MTNRLRIVIASIFLISLAVSGAAQYCGPEERDMQCGMDCTWDGYCALVVTPGGSTPTSTLCIAIPGGCGSHPNDCHCGGGGSF